MAVGGRVQPAQDVQQRRLAAARWAEHHHELAAAQLQVDAAQRLHLDIAHGVDLGQPLGAEDDLALRRIVHAVMLAGAEGRFDEDWNCFQNNSCQRPPTNRKAAFSP